MTFTEAIKSAFSRLQEFSGRSRRSEYWYVVLFTSIVYAVLVALYGITKAQVFMYIYRLFSLLMLLPSISVAIRRMHDVGRSTGSVLVGFIPFVGWILFLIWSTRDSEPGENKYGPNPKEAKAE